MYWTTISWPPNLRQLHFTEALLMGLVRGKGERSCRKCRRLTIGEATSSLLRFKC